jgi:TRAP-type C4-dicarboxylate transport system permease small subunit
VKKSIKIFEYFESSLLFVSKLAVFLMMLVTSADALCRYIFNSPIIGAYDFAENYLMVVAVFLSFSYVMRVNGHIKVDILVERLPQSFNKVMNIIFLLIAAVLMFVIGYQGFLSTEEALVNNYTTTGLIAWPTWLSVIWVPIGSFLFFIRLIIETIKIAFNIKMEDQKSNEVDTDIYADEEAAFQLALKINQEHQESFKKGSVENSISN